MKKEKEELDLENNELPLQAMSKKPIKEQLENLIMHMTIQFLIV